VRRNVHRHLACLALAGGVLLPAGCLVIPVDYHAAGSRHNVSPKSGERLQPGVSTRADVLLALGEPDFSSEDGGRLGYAWTKVKAIWFVGGYGGGAAGEALRSYVLEVTFDPESRMRTIGLLKEWGPAVTVYR
jgi:hypothetical protein